MKDSEKIGEKVKFKRENHVIEGIIEKLLNNSVVVSISQEAADKLNLSTTRTVVNFKKFLAGPRIEQKRRVM